jgi:hypothetical protein
MAVHPWPMHMAQNSSVADSRSVQLRGELESWRMVSTQPPSNPESENLGLKFQSDPEQYPFSPRRLRGKAGGPLRVGPAGGFPTGSVSKGFRGRPRARVEYRLGPSQYTSQCSVRPFHLILLRTIVSDGSVRTGIFTQLFTGGPTLYWRTFHRIRTPVCPELRKRRPRSQIYVS